MLNVLKWAVKILAGLSLLLMVTGCELTTAGYRVVFGVQMLTVTFASFCVIVVALIVLYAWGFFGSQGERPHIWQKGR
jgi:hypothetical protein